MSCKMDVPPPSSNVVLIHEVIDQNIVQRTTAPVVSTSIDEKQDSSKMAEVVGISNLVGSTENKTSCFVSGTSTEKNSDSQRTLVDKVIQECARLSGMSPVPCGSSVKQGDEVAVSFDKHDKEIVPESRRKHSSKLSGDLTISRLTLYFWNIPKLQFSLISLSD